MSSNERDLLMLRSSLWLLIVVAVVFIGCGPDEESSPVAPQLTIGDDNQDQVWHAGPDQGLLGVTDFWFTPGTLHGSSIVVYNGPSKIGYEVYNTEDPSIVYFVQGYIAPDEDAIQSGTIIPLDEWVHIRMVVYSPSIPGWMINFLNGVKEIFFDDLQPGWVERVFEVDVKLKPSNPGIHPLVFERTTNR